MHWSLIKFEPYQGTRTVPDVHRVGMGGSVALNLTFKLPANKPYDINFGNLFTRSALIDELSSRSIGTTGTLRTNHTECKIIQKTE